MATYDLREAANISAMGVPEGEDEFQHVGFKAQYCISLLDPSVLELPVAFECRYLSTHRLHSNSNHSLVKVVYGEVMHIHANDALLTAEGKMDLPKIRSLARLGYYGYSSVTRVFEMPIPGGKEATHQGLEGKSSLKT